MHSIEGENHFIINAIQHLDDFVMKTTALAILIALCGYTAHAAVGDTIVARWKHNTRGTFTMSFDDSMETHASIAMPAVIERGLVGTWFINPGTSRHEKNRRVLGSRWAQKWSRVRKPHLGTQRSA